MSNVFHISNTAPEGVIPDSLKWSFYIGGVVFISTILWTVIKSKEYTPEELATFEKDTKSKDNDSQNKVALSKQIIYGVVLLLIGTVFLFFIIHNTLAKELYILAGGIMLVGLLFLLASLLRSKGIKNAFVSIVSDLLTMPTTMKQLAWVQFFTWFALFSMWIYTTQTITHHIYHTSDTTSELYNKGADWVGVLFTVYNGVAALVAFLLPVLAKKTSRKFTHFIALLLGGIGLLSFYFITDPTLLLFSEIGVGIAWASILSMPYAILSGALPANKMGYFMGVFNFFIVIPQLIAATILGFLVSKFFDNDPVYALVIGGISMILAGILTLRVSDTDENK